MIHDSMNCPSCGLSNRPWLQECGHCAHELQETAAAEARRRGWDTLPASIRADYEKDYDLARTSFDEHRAWLKKHRITHCILGGVAVSFFMNSFLGFPAFWPLLIDLVIGAAAALRLNLKKGGSCYGASLFAAAALLSIAARFPFIDTEAFWAGWWLFSALSFAPMAGVGYYMGLKFDIQHVERNVLG